jgi:CRP-like cAMP-binding protein
MRAPRPERGPDPVIDVLRSVPELADLSETQLERLAGLVDPVEVASGQVLVREGTTSRQAFIVAEGCGVVFVDGQLVARIGPSEFIAEMGMLERQPGQATVRAETLMRLLVIDPEVFAELTAYPAGATAVATQLSRRLRRAEVSL